MRALLAAACMLGSTLFVSPATATKPPAPKGTAPAKQSVRAGTLSPEMVVAQRGVAEVQVAPDGKRIAYVVNVPRALDDDPGPGYQEIWVVDVTGAQPRRFTPSRQRAWAPAFAPDGERLAFLSTRRIGTGKTDDEETTGLFAMDTDGGEASPLTDGKVSVSSFRWSPSGESIAYIAKDLPTDEEKADKKKGRDWEVVDQNLKPQRLWALDVKSGAKRQVTTDATSVWSFDWAPDGNSLVTQVSDTPRTDDSYMYTRMALVPASGGSPAPLAHTQGKLNVPIFSPRGTQVAWLGATDLNDPFAGSVFVASVTGGEARNLSGKVAGDAGAIAWVDEQTLVVAMTHGTATTLELWPVRGGAPRTLLANGPIFTEFSLASATGQVAFAASTPVCPAEVFTGRLSGGKLEARRITTTNPDIEGVQLGAQEVSRWRAADGLEIEGILVKPLGFVAGRRYPLVVLPHGGPESCVRNGWTTGTNTWSQLLARDGVVVLLPNYRGSTGRGDDYERADHGDLGGKEFQDVLAGIDNLAQQGLVDPERVGIGGGSYGGYFTAWGSTMYSERFAVGVCWAGITNWISMQGTSDIPEENALVHWDLPFYENMNLYWERSPLSHVQKCRTPLLIGQGDKDARVPLGQGSELYTALRLLGREVEFVHYPREPHGMRESVHQLDYMKRGMDWFESHLKVGQAGVSSRR